METPDIIGFIGVFLILIAFFLNLSNKISHKSLAYILMNFCGAGIACYASYLVEYMPFIILEGIWTLVSFGGLVNYFQKKYARSN